MGVRKDTKKNKWLAEAYIDGKRVRKLFDSKADANRFYTALKEQNSPLFKLIQEKTPDVPLRLSDMVELWWKLHGQYFGKRNHLRNF